MAQTLFERVVALCALSPVLGPGTLRRALADVGATAATATVEDYCRAIPRLEVRLRAFMAPDEAALHARAILQLRGESPSSSPNPVYESGIRSIFRSGPESVSPPPSAPRQIAAGEAPASPRESAGWWGERKARG